MFFDWLACYQDYDFELPIVSDSGYCFIDFVNEEQGAIRQNRIHHEGSYSTSIIVHVQTNRITMSGNPSRYNRLDNLFGFTDLDDCFKVYNSILASLGLPLFTKCVKTGYVDHLDGSAPEMLFTGCVLTGIHLTTNFAVGAGCEDTYIKSLALLPYRRSRGRLHADGKTVDWLSIQGNARELYPSVYNKGYEIRLKSLPNVKRKFGEQSPEYQYLNDLATYCEQQGVTRHELKINSPYLKKHGLHMYGLSDLTALTQLHDDFLNIDNTLKVTAMDLRTISETLIEEGICENTKSANITALYAYNWMNGERFDGAKSQVQIHRARLRKIGIDILKPCNLLLFSPVIVKQVTEITKTVLQPPDFYKLAQLPHTSHLRLVA